MADNNFDWYKFHEVGCNLYDGGSDEELRTAINRFYYGAFCYARDYLIVNKIFHNNDLKEKICSNTGKVHEATRLIFKEEKKKINPKKGYNVHKYLYNLREYRNKVDYDSDADFNLNFMARKAKSYSEKIFDIVKNL